MVTIIFILLVVFACKGARGAARSVRRLPPRKASKAIPARQTSGNYSAVYALKEQREQIEKAIAYCEDLLAVEEDPEKVLRWMSKLGQLKGNLATVEAKLSRLYYGA